MTRNNIFEIVTDVTCKKQRRKHSPRERSHSRMDPLGTLREMTQKNTNIHRLSTVFFCDNLWLKRPLCVISDCKKNALITLLSLSHHIQSLRVNILETKKMILLR